MASSGNPGGGVGNPGGGVGNPGEVVGNPGGGVGNPGGGVGNPGEVVGNPGGGVGNPGEVVGTAGEKLSRDVFDSQRGNGTWFCTNPLCHSANHYERLICYRCTLPQNTAGPKNGIGYGYRVKKAPN